MLHRGEAESAEVMFPEESFQVHKVLEKEVQGRGKYTRTPERKFREGARRQHPKKEEQHHKKKTQAKQTERFMMVF
eukprot:220300-Heterocapsa_arctica.AAC.1